MELKLIVLAGAKQGTEIPLKKDQFVIGRAKECTLRAGSEAISRRHCAITRRAADWSVRDLGSRNGTYVNDQRIEAETPLAVGDELRVGPLKFRVAPHIKRAAEEVSEQSPKPAKQPPARTVSDVAQRTADKAADGTTEEDVSRWLLGIVDQNNNATLKETRTIRMEETATLKRDGQPTVARAPDTTGEDADSSDDSAAEKVDSSATVGESTDEAAGKSGWSWRKLGKGGAAKRKPGKLPARANEELSKDSREAAADILREMTRRR